jgi:hypothetical protein
MQAQRLRAWLLWRRRPTQASEGTLTKGEASVFGPDGVAGGQWQIQDFNIGYYQK